MTYPVVTDLADDGIPVKLSCRVLGFSRQAYYAWLANPVSDREWADAHAANAVFDAHADDPEFGYRFLADELRDQGLDVSDHRVLKACRIARVRCCHSIRRGCGKRPGPPVHDDLVRREFTADRPNQLWLTDISEHSTGDGKLYLCAVKDVFSNRIVGYSIDRRMTSRLAVDALQMAVARRGGKTNVAGCRVHSDRGSQGGFNWSSQHLVRGVCDGSSSAGRGSGYSSEAALAGASEVPAAGRGGLLESDRARAVAGGGLGSCGRGASGRGEVVPQRWRHATVRLGFQPLRPLPAFRGA